MSVAAPPKKKPAKSLPVKKHGTFRDFLEMIKFEHTLFALPFAYTGALLAGQGKITLLQFLWITLAMVAARTAGMSLNRLIDKKLDALNPRTSRRALPAGLIQSRTVWLIVAASIALLALACANLNPLCLELCPLAVFLLFTYSYLKRFTWLCHVGLGLVLASAPIGGWLAVAGHFALTPLALGAAMVFWLAGFDTLYACLDYDFDVQFGVHSIPRRFGIDRALWISVFFHVLTFIFFALTGYLAQLSWAYGIGLALIAGLLLYEHAIVTPRDLSRVNQAFFQANAVISFLILAFTAAGLWLQP